MPQQERWAMFNQVRRRHAFMDRMMSRLGIDMLTAVRIDQGRAFVDARTKCRNCEHEAECRAWLESPETRPLLPGFCPNAGFFHRCGLFGAYGLGRERRFKSAEAG
jgi:hypothetical protein